MSSTAATVVKIAFPGGKKPAPAATRFRKGGSDELATIVSLIRGAQIAAMDHAFLEGRFGAKLGRDHPDPVVRERASDLFQSLMLDLFPEEFADPEDSLPPGVVPPAGPRRVGEARLLRYAKLTGMK